MSDTGSISVILAESHPVFRAGIRTFLIEAPEIVVVAETDDSHAARDLTLNHRPDVLLLDLFLTAPRPTHTVRSLCRKCAETEVLLLTAHNRYAYLWAMTDAGAAGCFVKDEASESLVETVRRVANGLPLHNSRQLRLAQTWHEQVGRRWSRLTEREREVLRYLGRFHTNTEIGEMLGISDKTVGHHVQHILRKLAVSSRREAGRWAIEHLDELDFGRGEKENSLF
ncbi:MAG TPA: response regulator transcription factor [Candidatus Sulfomarinibacteraceae bacterium]|nr:response regulator transcription factor [Candidatus Sulfomarinibacteraceae bacterium]